MDEEILETAKSICACGAEDEALLKRLCAASAQALERELREGVAPEDCEGAFICASAWLAAAALTDARLGGAEELSSLRAGDVTIEVRGGANSERAAQRAAADGPVYGRRRLLLLRSEGMKSMIDQAFRRYGMTVTVEHGAETGETHGFVQPVTAVSGGEPFSVGPLGAADRRCWRYLGSAEVSVAQGDHILCEGKRYRVRRAESVKLGALVTHYWAVLDREEETA